MDKIKTAFVLGGGGARGAYEIGCWQALRELDIKADMCFGTSVGSINSAIIAQDSFELAVELWHDIDTEMIFDVDVKDINLPVEIDIAGMPIEEAAAYAREILKNKGASADGLYCLLSKYIDEDAIRKSDTGFGLVTVELDTLTPKYMYIDDIPYGRLNDYIIASCAIAPAVHPYKIDDSYYIDGGFYDNIPVSMALKKNASNIIAVDLQAVGNMRKQDIEEAEEKADKFIRISSRWDMGSVLSFEEHNARRLIRLGYLDALKAFDVFSGSYYTFPMGTFDKKTLSQADMAAKAFHLDPTVIYRKDILNTRLAEKVREHMASVESSREFHRPSSVIDLLSKKISRRTIILFTAQELKDGRLLNHRAARKLLKDFIPAAEYLIKNNIV